MEHPGRDAAPVGSGLGDREWFGDYVARYCRRAARHGLPHLDFYLAYNFFRLAAILQGIAGRVRDGTAVNPNAAAMEAQVEPLARTAWSFARKARR